MYPPVGVSMSPGIAKRRSGNERCLVPGARHVGLPQCHANALDPGGLRAQPPAANRLRHALEDLAGHEFGGGFLAGERRMIVEVGVFKGCRMSRKTCKARPMSTTILSAPRLSRMKATSTTKVAPCRRCAGPKTSPGKLWAIMM